MEGSSQKKASAELEHAEKKVKRLQTATEESGEATTAAQNKDQATGPPCRGAEDSKGRQQCHPETNSASSSQNKSSAKRQKHRGDGSKDAAGRNASRSTDERPDTKHDGRSADRGQRTEPRLQKV